VAGTAVPSQVLPTVTESWLKSDGTGRVLSITRKAKGSSIDDVRIQAGEPLLALSAEETGLASRLAVGHPIADASASEFVALADLASRQPISPPVEAATLRVLARVTGLINSGTVIDRGGRAGVAVSLISAYAGVMTSYTLIFDPGTGKLLEAEQTLTGSPKELDVRQGAILAYTTFIASGYVANTTTRP
jgi:hypothetical protein